MRERAHTRRHVGGGVAKAAVALLHDERDLGALHKHALGAVALLGHAALHQVIHHWGREGGGGRVHVYMDGGQRRPRQHAGRHACGCCQASPGVACTRHCGAGRWRPASLPDACSPSLAGLPHLASAWGCRSSLRALQSRGQAHRHASSEVGMRQVRQEHAARARRAGLSGPSS